MDGTLTGDERDTVTLKVNGKAFKCPGKHPTTKRKCGCKDFRVVDTAAGEPLQLDITVDRGLDPALRAAPVYACMQCNWQRVGGADVEALLPARNDWCTPGGSALAPEPNGLWTTLHEEYRFTVDVAANAENTKCPLYYDGKDESSNALLRNWFGSDLVMRARKLNVFSGMPLAQHARIWDNCPYKPVGTIETWLRKALEQAALGVFSVHLIPMSSSTTWFNDLVVPFAEWHTFRGRIAFIDPLSTPESERTSPKQDNLLVIYNPYSTIVGHTAVRDSKTGKKVWGLSR